MPNEIKLYSDYELKVRNHGKEEFIVVDLVYRYNADKRSNLMFWLSEFKSNMVVVCKGVEYVYAGHLTTWETLDLFKRDFIAKEMQYDPHA